MLAQPNFTPWWSAKAQVGVRGSVLRSQGYRNCTTQGSSRISRKNPSDGPGSMVYQRPGTSIQTNDSLWWTFALWKCTDKGFYWVTHCSITLWFHNEMLHFVLPALLSLKFYFALFWWGRKMSRSGCMIWETQRINKKKVFLFFFKEVAQVHLVQNKFS